MGGPHCVVSTSRRSDRRVSEFVQAKQLEASSGYFVF